MNNCFKYDLVFPCDLINFRIRVQFITTSLRVVILARKFSTFMHFTISRLLKHFVILYTSICIEEPFCIVANFRVVRLMLAAFVL